LKYDNLINMIIEIQSSMFEATHEMKNFLVYMNSESY
jgi:hypothetical protein